VRGVPGKADLFEIVAGERRWRAAQKAGLHDVPVVLMEIGDREALEIAIVENVQRTDLNALEEASGYESLIQEFKYSQNDPARVVGKSRSHVANTLRLQKLPASVKRYLSEGKLTAGHARALLGSVLAFLIAQFASVGLGLAAAGVTALLLWLLLQANRGGGRHGGWGDGSTIGPGGGFGGSFGGGFSGGGGSFGGGGASGDW